MLPPASERVPRHTGEHVNERIRPVTGPPTDRVWENTNAHCVHGSVFLSDRAGATCFGHIARGVSDRRAQELFPARKATRYLFAAALLTRSSKMTRLIGLAKWRSRLRPSDAQTPRGRRIPRSTSWICAA
jgi:hypothetical protein